YAGIVPSALPAFSAPNGVNSLPSLSASAAVTPADARADVSAAATHHITHVSLFILRPPLQNLSTKNCRPTAPDSIGRQAVRNPHDTRSGRQHQVRQDPGAPDQSLVVAQLQILAHRLRKLALVLDVVSEQ